MTKQDLNPENLKELQKIVDALKTQPQYSQYIKEHKLELLDSNFRVIDGFLDAGFLQD